MGREIQRGELYWLGGADSDGLAHPHLVVQDDVFNRSRLSTVIVCALTSNLKRANEPGNVLLEPGEGGLPRQSVVVVSQISSVETADLGERIGALTQERVDQVLGGLRFQQASFFRRAAAPVQIREERREDVAVISDLVREAFRQAPHGGGNEQDIVEGLRAAGALSISLVAEADGELVGHVALSPVRIEDGTQGWYGLGPIAVAPTRQRRGIGSMLMGAAMKRLRENEAAGCVLLGDPAYYRRFGFEPAAPLVLPGVPAEYFQALDLNGPRPRGTVHYHEAFDIDAADLASADDE